MWLPIRTLDGAPESKLIVATACCPPGPVMIFNRVALAVDGYRTEEERSARPPLQILVDDLETREVGDGLSIIAITIIKLLLSMLEKDSQQ